jgi:hypothetical protein
MDWSCIWFAVLVMQAMFAIHGECGIPCRFQSQTSVVMYDQYPERCPSGFARTMHIHCLQQPMYTLR